LAVRGAVRGGKAIRTREAGFTLVEALVAFAVFTLVISALYQGLSGGWRGLRRADASVLALAVAKARLASAGVETPLAISTDQGVTAEGVRWVSEIVPYVPPGTLGAQRSAVSAFWVLVTVRWTEGPLQPERSLQLKTLKFQRVEP
jgi:general secretion pathway protein I